MCLAEAIVGASFGAITVGGHMPAWVPIVMSIAIFAGGAQFAAASVVVAGGGATAAVLAGLLINARLIAFGFTVADLFDGPWWKRVFGAHVMTDESVAFALRQPDPRRRRAAFWTCGITLFATWSLATALGACAGRAILVRRKQLTASCGVHTIGSLSLNEVLSTTGVPVSSPKAWISSQ